MEKEKGTKWNWKVSMFRSSIIERIIWKAPLYPLRAIYVNVRNASREGEKTGKKLETLSFSIHHSEKNIKAPTKTLKDLQTRNGSEPYILLSFLLLHIFHILWYIENDVN